MVGPKIKSYKEHRIQAWFGEFIDRLLPFKFFYYLPRSARMMLDKYVNILLLKFFLFSKLASFKREFTRFDIPFKSWCFIKEAEKRGIKFKVFSGPFGYTNHFQMIIKGKVFYFDGLPTASFLSRYGDQVVDDKEGVRRRLKKGGFPFVEGKSFWFFQRKKALHYGINRLGFPLVVKPRSGSQSICVTTDIRNVGELKKAIKKTLAYEPTFIVEKFFSQGSVFRVTVIDFKHLFCVEQLPANVVGDGNSTIRALIREKNNNSQRGLLSERGFILHKLVINKTTENLLKEKKYSFSTIPKKGERIWLQKDSFLRFGGDLREVTPKVHSDNIQLFRDIAKFFDIRVVGIDFLAENISVSWKKQKCAVLELNSLPSIEMHHFPYEGEPQNAARSLLRMVLKYYL